MLVFVCRFQFGDFKYNNIPLNANGRAIFIDLDNWGAEEGLTKGFAASQTDGLLSYLPQEWLDEMIDRAERILGKSIEVDSVRERVSKYARWRKEYRGFLAEREVENVTDPVFFKKESDASPEKLAEAFCELFNEQLIAVPSCDSMVGRRLQVDFDATSSFWKYAIKPRGFTKFVGFGAASEEAFLNNVPRAFELLKARKIIFDFEYRTNATEAVVYV